MHKKLYITFLLYLNGLLAMAQQPTAYLTRIPYLQVVTPTGITVRWRTDKAVTGQVWYGTNPDQMTAIASETQPTTEHIVSLTGLQPASTYFYAVGQPETKIAYGADYTFKTALPAGDRRPFRIWALGDFGCGTDNQYATYDQYKKVAAQNPANLWLWLGDNAYSAGYDEQFQQFVFNAYTKTLPNLPFWPVPGNHDYGNNADVRDLPYFNLFNFPQKGEAGGLASGSKQYYSFDYGNVHFVALDSYGYEAGLWRLADTTGTQVQWLKRDLAATKQPWKVVFFHHPPYSKGSHNSDTDPELIVIRENLTGILERYGVDLVLSGHSHLYERSYRLRGLKGPSTSFTKSTDLAEQTNGRYDGTPNSCPMLAKGEGTVYIVAGSGGQMDQAVAADYPHVAMAYSNTTVGGSVLIDMNDNRMDVKWLTSTGQIGDQFTILKNTNRTQRLSLEYGEQRELQASWPGEYRWQSGQTGRSITVSPTQPGSFAVTDPLNCLRDEFQLSVLPKPRLVPATPPATSVCVGTSFPVLITAENSTKADQWTYDIQLSDAAGRFDAPTVIGSGTRQSLRATIPAALPAGSGYRYRVVTKSVDFAESVESATFAVKGLSMASLSGNATIMQGSSTPLSITFTGDGPWKGVLSDGTAFSATTSPVTLTVQPQATTTYQIQRVENNCGAGMVSGQALVTVQVIMGAEELAGGTLAVYPNPTSGQVSVDLTLPSPQAATLTVLNTQGQVVQTKGFKASTAHHSQLQLPATAGTYLIRIEVNGKQVTRRVVKL
nr:metallophosphoesterase [uncultured Arsenicibacter sp.]